MRRFLILSVAFVLSIGCVRDHLYYQTSDEVTVQLNIDWSVSGFSPNGVTVYVYDSKGDRYGSSILSSTVDVVTMTLPSDTYTFVVHNDSRSEFSNVEFLGSDKLSTFMVRSLEWDHPYYEPDSLEFVAYEPEDIVAATVRDIDVSSSAIKYHYDKPKLSEYTSSEVLEVDIVPEYIVHLAEVQAHFEHAYSLVSVPVALVHGMSRGYNFGTESTIEDEVLSEFYVDITTVIYTEEERAELDLVEGTYADDIYLDFRTFGYPPTSFDMYLEFLFYMSNGMLYHIYSDVTDATTLEDLGIRDKYTIIINDDLDNYEPYWDDNFNYEDDVTEGDMNPSVDDWIDIVVTVPM